MKQQNANAGYKEKQKRPKVEGGFKTSYRKKILYLPCCEIDYWSKQGSDTDFSTVDII